MNKRVDWIDYAKGIGIIIVMLIHAQMDGVCRTWVRLWIIPLFFFLAGIFARSEQYTNLRDFFRRKTWRLLKPYIVFNIISYLFWLLLGRHYGADAGNEIVWWKPLVGILQGYYPMTTHYLPLWFLPCMMVCETLYYLVIHYLSGITQRVNALGVLSAIGIAAAMLDAPHCVWGIDIALVMLPIYAIGAMGKEFMENGQWWVDCLVLIGGVALTAIAYFLNPQEVHVYANQYGNMGLFYTGAIGGIAVVCGVCRLLALLPTLHLLSLIGRNTLYILCLHLMAYSVVKGICVYVLHVPLTFFSTGWGIATLCVFGLVLLMPICMLRTKLKGKAKG